MRPQRNRDDKMRFNLNTKAGEGARGPFVGDLCYVVIFITYYHILLYDFRFDF